MKTINHVVLGVTLAFIFVAGCESMQEVLNIQKPKASIKGLKFEDVALDSATLVFDVEVENPYPIALPLTNMDYGLSSGGKAFLSGSAEIAGTVPAKSKRTIALPAKVNYLDMLRALKGIRPGSKIPYKADVGLRVDTPALGSLELPLKKEGEIVLPSVSDIKADDIWKIIKGE